MQRSGFILILQLKVDWGGGRWGVERLDVSSVGPLLERIQSSTTLANLLTLRRSPSLTREKTRTNTDRTRVYFKVLFRVLLKIYTPESFFVASLSLDDLLVVRLVGIFVLTKGRDSNACA